MRRGGLAARLGGPMLAILAVACGRSGGRGGDGALGAGTGPGQFWPPPALLTLAPAGEPVAYVAGTAIGRPRLERQRALAAELGAGEQPEAGLEQLLAGEIRHAQLLHAAYDRGFAGHPEVVAAAQQAMVKALLRAELVGQGGPWEDQEAALERAYASHRNRWMRPRLRQVDAAAWSGAGAEARAQAALATLPPGGQHGRGIDASWRQAHGAHRITRLDPGHWLAEPALARLIGDRAARAAFAAEVPGVVAEVQRCPGVVCVLAVLGEQGGQRRGPEEALDQLREQALERGRQQAFDHFLAELRGSYPARYDAQGLAALAEAWHKPPQPPPAPP